MRDIADMEFNKTSEKVVKMLQQKTQNPNPLFFRILISYYFSKVASSMRVNIKTLDRGTIPVNLYAMNLASSGQGKGLSTNIVEESIINQFQENFLEYTLPTVAAVSLAKLANKRAIKKSTDPDEEQVLVEKEYVQAGEFAFSFDSGTPAAVKQMRHKLMMAEAGSVNMEIDEIGSNLLGQQEVLNVFLELYDVGKVKQKLTKNTAENTRGAEIIGKTPTNMMLYGTPDKLMDGGKVEEEFRSMLETGYARRCFCGYIKSTDKDLVQLTPEEEFAQLTDNSTNTFINDLSDHLGLMADPINFGKEIIITKAVTLLLIEYRQLCERKAAKLASHQGIRKAEVAHRYFKALKLAGAYAFIEGSHEITEAHLYSAIKLAEESGVSFEELLNQDRSYVKLAKYISTVGREVTHVDLVEALPSYKGSSSQKAELLTLAIAWGYKNNVSIKKIYRDGIEFLEGECLTETNLDELVLSYSTHQAFNYNNELVPFSKLHTLVQAPGHHWVNHHLNGGHRTEEKAIEGFNVIVIDVDKGVNMATAKMLLKDYKALYYTTKRHRLEGEGDRYRIIMPINYTLKMGATDFKEFMTNIFEWLPFAVDEGTSQRARKWLSHDGGFEYTEGKLLDALLFIPKTTKTEERKKLINDQQSLTNVERWFVSNTGAGNRSNQLIKYALLLVDSGQNIDAVCNNVLALNNKLADKLEEAEVLATVLVSARRAIDKRSD